VQVGERAFDPGLTLIDDPLLDARPGSRPLDDEGVPSVRTVVVESGVVKGLLYDIESATRVRGTSVCMTFGQNGTPPLSPAIPTLVADFVDVYELGSGGRWLIRERHIHRIFVDPANTGPVGR